MMILETIHTVKRSAYADRIEVENSGWIGFTDHFWMATLFQSKTTGFALPLSIMISLIFFRQRPFLVPDCGYRTVGKRNFLPFCWSKRMGGNTKLRKNRRRWLLDSIDWGWFFFLTKPIFAALHYLNKFIGNTGWAIIGLTC